MLHYLLKELSLLEHDVCPILGIGPVAFLRQQALSRNTHLQAVNPKSMEERSD